MSKIKKETIHKSSKDIRMKTFKRTALILGIFIITSSIFVTAFYLVTFKSTGSYVITGGVSEFVVISELVGGTLDVSSNLSLIENVSLDNQDGEFFAVYNNSVIETNLDPTNCNSFGDILYLFEHSNGTEINFGETILIEEGLNEYALEIQAINERVCPQEINVSIFLTAT